MQPHETPAWTPLQSSASAGRVAVPPQTHSVASASASAGARSGAPRRRYPPELYDILTEYYENVNAYPKKPERIMLAERVMRIPGCEDYTPEKVNTYFAGKRQSHRRELARKGASQPAPQSQAQAGPETSSSGHILYPSIASAPSVLPKLNVLLTETPEPTPEIARIWAMRLGHDVDPTDIITYADLQRAQKRPGKPLPRIRSQLPTPESSISPEPHHSPTSPVVQTSWGKVEPEEDVKDELASDYEDDSVETKAEPHAETVPDTRLALIAGELSRALSVPSSPVSDAPKTFKDLSRWFREQQSATVFLDGLGRPPMQSHQGSSTTVPYKPPPTV